MNSKRLYEIIGVKKDATIEEIEEAYNDRMTELYIEKNCGKITRDEFNEAFDELNNAHDILVNAYDEYEEDLEDEEPTRRRGGLGKKIIAGAVAAAVAVSIFAGAYAFTKRNSNAESNQVGYETSSEKDNPESQNPDQSQGQEQSQDQGQSQEEGQTEGQEQGQEQGQENGVKNIPAAVQYGSIKDGALVQERATALVNELKAMNIVNPTSGSLYTVEEITALILYANGVYTPETMEEIDVLHLNLLNLLISPLNTDEYLYHVVYATGNDDFKDMAVEAATNVKPIDFASAFAEYEQNGVYPLTQWMQQKREQIYSTTDREEINRIYVEVGQVMADIMKGNGCTITIYEDKQEYTYTFTSEQILANHASAMLLTIDAQLIFANHYEVRDENDKVIASTQTSWEVYNKFLGDEPDHVSLDEIQAWINNGCDYEWGIEDVLIDGQTFGQRIQGDMEGMAQNNYAMSGNKSLTK
ncbi:MAG: J domain-containing protein [Bacilli bacterium]|nr:J domain-containing protein [Bacilli bacterium]